MPGSSEPIRSARPSDAAAFSVIPVSVSSTVNSDSRQACGATAARDSVKHVPGFESEATAIATPASIIERAVSQWGLPNGYVLGEEGSGAFVAGLRYGEGTLYTKNAGDLRVYWQGPSVGFDWGGDGARTMTLVYNLPATAAIYQRFVGIVVPHLVRLLAGPDHRFVLPGSALLGASLLLVADVIARMIVRPAELPLGIVMAAVGAPVFLHLVLRRGIGGVE